MLPQFVVNLLFAFDAVSYFRDLTCKVAFKWSNNKIDGNNALGRNEAFEAIVSGD